MGDDGHARTQADLDDATGVGTDVATDAADLVLTRPKPLDVAITVRIGRKALRAMRQDLAWAIGYNAVTLPIAASVLAPSFRLVLRPEIAGLTMSGSSLLVAVNALVLERLHLPAQAAAHDPGLEPADAATTRPAPAAR